MKTLGFLKFFQLFSNWKEFFEMFSGVFFFAKIFLRVARRRERKCRIFQKRNFSEAGQGPKRNGAEAAQPPERSGAEGPDLRRKRFFLENVAPERTGEPPSKKFCKEKSAWKHFKNFFQLENNWKNFEKPSVFMILQILSKKESPKTRVLPIFSDLSFGEHRNSYLIELYVRAWPHIEFLGEITDAHFFLVNFSFYVVNHQNNLE